MSSDHDGDVDARKGAWTAEEVSAAHRAAGTAMALAGRVH